MVSPTPDRRPASVPTSSDRLLRADPEADEAARLDAERAAGSDGRADCPEWWRQDLSARLDAAEGPLP